jgi:hypothetical protein
MLWKNKEQFSHSTLQNAAAFRTVSTGPAAINQQTNKTTKPDTSLATKTGHFHLLPTQLQCEHFLRCEAF